MAITKIATANHEEWKALRAQYIGGSDAAAVVGLNRFSSPYALWAEKTGRTPQFEGNLATDVGTFLEEFIAKRFETVSGKKVRRDNRSFINDRYPWAIANIDRDIVGEDAGLECKSTSALNVKRFKGGEFPENYYCQCVHYLAVTERVRWYIAVLIGNQDFKVYHLTRIENESCPEWCEASLYISDEEISALMEAEKDFWYSNVKADVPPIADGTKPCTNAIKTIYSESSEDSVNLSMFETDLEQRAALSAQIGNLEKLRDAVDNKIKAYMGNASRGESNRYRVTWTSSQRNNFDRKRFEKEHPSLNLNGYFKTTTTRTFKVTEV
jgi:putative phage-type endonuclease